MFAFVTISHNRVSWQIEDGRTGSDPINHGNVTRHSLWHPDNEHLRSVPLLSNAAWERRMIVAKNVQTVEDAKAKLSTLGVTEFQVRIDRE